MNSRPPLDEIADALWEIGMIEAFNLDMLELRAARRGRGVKRLDPLVVAAARRRAVCVVEAHTIMRQSAAASRPYRVAAQ